MAGMALLVLALLAAVWPRVIAVPLAATAMWLAVTLLVRAWILHRERMRNLRAAEDVPEALPPPGWRRVGKPYRTLGRCARMWGGIVAPRWVGPLGARMGVAIDLVLMFLVGKFQHRSCHAKGRLARLGSPVKGA